MTQPLFPSQGPDSLLTFVDGRAVLLGSHLLSPRRAGSFLLCLLLGLTRTLSLLALLVKLLEFGSTGSQPLLTRPALLLLPALPGSLHSLGHLRLDELLPRGGLVLFVLGRLLPKYGARGGFLLREDGQSMSQLRDRPPPGGGQLPSQDPWVPSRGLWQKDLGFNPALPYTVFGKRAGQAPTV